MNYFTHYDKLDSDMQSVVEQLLKFNPPPIEKLDYANARNNPTLKNAVEEMASQSLSVRTKNVALPSLPEQVNKIKHILVPTRDGEVLARIYYPSEDLNLPVIIYFHGGGWVIANLDIYESSCRALCNAAKAIVVSVAYRQAPEAKFPAPINDAYDAAQWIMQNAPVIGGDLNRVAIAGESAGGNLATVTCIQAKDKGGMMPLAQLLIYPVTDTSMTQPSYVENLDTQPLHSSMMPWFWKHYLREDADLRNKYVAPLMADDLTGLPPAIIITAEFDPLRDEGEQYAVRLNDAGGMVKLRRFNGVVHEFFGLAGAVSKAKEAVNYAAEGLRDIFEIKEKRHTV